MQLQNLWFLIPFHINHFSIGIAGNGLEVGLGNRQDSRGTIKGRISIKERPEVVAERSRLYTIISHTPPLTPLPGGQSSRHGESGLRVAARQSGSTSYQNLASGGIHIINCTSSRNDSPEVTNGPEDLSSAI